MPPPGPPLTSSARVSSDADCSAADMKYQAKRARAALRSLQKRASQLRQGLTSDGGGVPLPVGEDVRRAASDELRLAAPLLAEVRSMEGVVVGRCMKKKKT